MSRDELKAILADHYRWLVDCTKGKRANLRGANLSGANLSGANLIRADLSGANLRGATLPDGRTFDVYREDHMAGLCTTTEVMGRAVGAWGKHSWEDCPMHAAHGWSKFEDAPKALLVRVGAWVALYDGGHLPAPRAQAQDGAR